MYNAETLWAFLPIGYLLTILIEAPILMIGLSPRHPWTHRLFAGVWLTACTYPIVVLVLPLLFTEMGVDIVAHRWIFLLPAEAFAHFGECALFWMAFGKRDLFNTRSFWRDMAVVFFANLASFLSFEVAYALGWW
jgi:hypothetical protein